MELLDGMELLDAKTQVGAHIQGNPRHFGVPADSVPTSWSHHWLWLAAELPS